MSNTSQEQGRNISHEKEKCCSDTQHGIENENNDSKETFQWTFGKYLLLFELSLVIFFNFGSFSILATFFPLEVRFNILYVTTETFIKILLLYVSH